MKRHNTDEILKSIDGIERATAEPYLYSKILNRLSESPRPRYIWNLACVLLIVAALNVFTLFSFKDKTNDSENKAAIVANEYEIYIPAYY